MNVIDDNSKINLNRCFFFINDENLVDHHALEDILNRNREDWNHKSHQGQNNLSGLDFFEIFQTAEEIKKTDLSLAIQAKSALVAKHLYEILLPFFDIDDIELTDDLLKITKKQKITRKYISEIQKDINFIKKEDYTHEIRLSAFNLPEILSVKDIFAIAHNTQRFFIEKILRLSQRRNDAGIQTLAVNLVKKITEDTEYTVEKYLDEIFPQNHIISLKTLSKKIFLNRRFKQLVKTIPAHDDNDESIKKSHFNVPIKFFHNDSRLIVIKSTIDRINILKNNSIEIVTYASDSKNDITMLRNHIAAMSLVQGKNDIAAHEIFHNIPLKNIAFITWKIGRKITIKSEKKSIEEFAAECAERVEEILKSYTNGVL